MGLFKRKINPITGADFSGVYVSPVTGSDLNSGVIDAPYATLTKSFASGSKDVLINGKTTENIVIPQNSRLIGDSEFSECTGIIDFGLSYNPSYIYGVKFNYLIGNCLNISNSYITTLISGCYPSVGLKQSILNCFIVNYSARTLGETNNDMKQNTIYNYSNYMLFDLYRTISNSIFVNYLDLYNYTSRTNSNYIPIFKYCLFRKATIWKWNGSVIPINYGTYGNAAGDYMADVISGLYAYANAMTAGTDKNYFLAMIPSAASSNIFYVDINGQTCKVIEDRPSVAGSKKIFNRYVNDVPVDYSLFLDKDNVALTMSDQMSYVGCYKANADVLTFGNVVNVNADGTDDLGTTPDMLIADGNGKFHVSSADSVQTRNRVRSNVFTFKRGFSLVGFQSQMKSGLGSRFSIGKFQPYNITNAPTLPQESIEVIPYDNATTPSAFPRFSAMFNDVCQMWYHTTGAKVGQPVLFNDLLSFFAITTDKNLTEYGNWAVTNADYETYLLSAKTGVTLKNVPVNFAKVEINLNYYV